MRYLRLDHVDLLALHGINNRQFLDCSLKKGGCLEAARKLQREGRVRSCRFFHPCHHRYHSGGGEQRRVRLMSTCTGISSTTSTGPPSRQRASRTWACSSSARTTRAENSTSRRPNWSALCRAADPDAVQRPVLPGPAGGAHPELRRGTPRRFRRACGRWTSMSASRQRSRRSKSACAPRWRGCWERDWCAALVRGPAGIPGCARAGQPAGDPAVVDLCQVARPGRLGQDALQSARPGGSLVSRGKRRPPRRVGLVSQPSGQPLCRREFPAYSRKLTRCCLRSRWSA